MIWKEISHISITEEMMLNIEIGILLVLIFFVIVVVFLVLKVLNLKIISFFSHDVELNISLGGIGGIKIKPNHEVAQISHKAWTELITRKAGLPFDPENDIIVEVYDSWYVLFGRIRNLVKDIPVNQIKDENTQKLIDLLINSLNRGLRPHLTKWQAKFRKWYENEIEKEESKNKSPQEIQKVYSQYSDLLYDLVTINQQLVSYTVELKKLIF